MKIAIRRTVELDFTQQPWVAEVDVSGTLAARIVPAGGPKSEPTYVVKTFGNSPEDALARCYTDIGKRACTTLDIHTVAPATAESASK